MTHSVSSQHCRAEVRHLKGTTTTGGKTHNRGILPPSSFFLSYLWTLLPKCQTNKQNRISVRTATICQRKELRPDILLWTYHVTVLVDCRMVKSHSTTPVTLRAHLSLQCSTERGGKQCCSSCNKLRSENDFFSEKSRQILPKASIVWEYFKENKLQNIQTLRS